jgi:hypothetical protein
MFGDDGGSTGVDDDFPRAASRTSAQPMSFDPRRWRRRYMTEEHAGAWTRSSAIVKARPEELYEAFMDPDALTRRPR